MYDYYALEDKTAAKIHNVAAASANLVGAGMLAKAELTAAASEGAAQMRQKFDPTLLQAAEPAQTQWY
ncbi:hypothetical protein [Chitinophaga agri]|uniref:hypothetical protein n=1 Tax=Chitinophaga agri TaxID=2703787 RepID=UPI001391EF3D|nr:hypothetical protein [Chitinophaga agri]